MATYTQTAGDSLGRKYFMDVEISPVTVADGSLVRRFDTTTWPKVGVKTLHDPEITSLDVSTIAEGTADEITITGTHFKEGATVSVSGAGVAVSNVRRTDSGQTELVCTVTAAEGAAQTARNVTVTNLDGGTDTATGALTVVLGTVTIASVTPGSEPQDTTDDIGIVGTGFEPGATVTISGTGITVNSTTVDSATLITANITVGPAATQSARNVTVTNTDTTTATATGALTVT